MFGFNIDDLFIEIESDPVNQSIPLRLRDRGFILKAERKNLAGLLTIERLKTEARFSEFLFIFHL